MSISYNTTVINTSREDPFEWKEIASNIIFTTDANICTIETPRQYGKTTFAADLIDEFSCARGLKLFLYAAIDRHRAEEFRHLKKQCVFTVSGVGDLPKLPSEMAMDLIIADDANAMDPIFLHSLVMYGALHGSMVILLGSPKSCRAESKRTKREAVDKQKKDLWAWIKNGPSSESIIVKEASPVQTTIRLGTYTRNIEDIIETILSCGKRTVPAA